MGPVISKIRVSPCTFSSILPRITEEQMIGDGAQSLVCDAAVGEETLAASPKSLGANSPLVASHQGWCWPMVGYLLPSC